MSSRRIDAKRIADVLDQHGFTAEEARGADEHTWHLAASLAGVSSPSFEVCGAAVAILADRQANPDPFASFKGSDR